MTLNGSPLSQTDLIPDPRLIKLHTRDKGRIRTNPAKTWKDSRRRSSTTGGAMTRHGNDFSKLQLTAIAVLSLVALGFSGYLAWHAINMTQVAGCGGGSVFNCDHVLTSKWSKFLGVPVAVFALLTYTGMLSSLAAYVGGNETLKTYASTSMTFLCWLAGLAAIWFVGLQVFAIGHLCQYCLVAHSCGFALMLMMAFSGKPTVGRRPYPLVCAISAVSVLGLTQAATQPPPTYQIEEYVDAANDEMAPSVFAPDEDPALFEPDLFEPELFEPDLLDSEVDVVPEVATSSEPTLIEPEASSPVESEPVVPKVASPNEIPTTTTSSILRSTSKGLAKMLRARATLSVTAVVSLIAVTQEAAATGQAKKSPARQQISFGRIATLRTDQWPLIGDKMAPHVTAEMFDYTCPSCRATAPALEKAFKDYNGKMAIIALPVPINRNCNDTVTATPAGHQWACELAKVALSVWLVNPEKFPEFHHWMMQGNNAPQLGNAMAQARALVGTAEFDKMYNSARPGKYLRANIKIYKMAGKGQIPKLLLKKTSLVGKTTSADVIKNLVARN